MTRLVKVNYVSPLFLQKILLQRLRVWINDKQKNEKFCDARAILLLFLLEALKVGR